MLKKVSVCLAMFAMLAGSSSWASHHEGGLEALVTTWQDAYNSGDLKAVTALYMEDGMRMPPDQPAVKGRKAIHAQLQAGLDGGLAKVKIEATEMKVMGEMGVAHGTFEGMDAEGNTITKGKWANATQMVDGKWQVQYDIFNYDAPMTAPE